jgi:Fur family ferric uptake transcriptional regulator
MTKKIEHLLSSCKMRKTAARIAILDILADAGKPQTAEQIASKLGTKACDKVTIYRTLECFVKAGFVHRAYLEARKWHFELADRCSEKQCHPHFVCNSCGQTRCLPKTSSPPVKIRNRGFVVHRQQIKLEGLCPSCSTKRLKIS